jgi:isocitrate lyase
VLVSTQEHIGRLHAARHECNITLSTVHVVCCGQGGKVLVSTQEHSTPQLNAARLQCDITLSTVHVVCVVNRAARCWCRRKSTSTG